MNLRNIFWVLLILPFLSASQDIKTDFKIITYNIWNGYDWGKDNERREKVQNWFEDQAPDVVALQELCAYTPEKLREDAQAWGHDYSILLKTSGYSVGLSSKYPIKVKERIMEGMHHGALHCTTKGIDVLVVHLHPGSIARRREETEIISEKLKSIATTTSKYVVLGDFNAHSPLDAHLYDDNGDLLNRLRKSNEGKGLDGNLVNNDLDYAVISKFLSLPLYDPIEKHTMGLMERGSFPGRVLGKVNQETTKQLLSRMERIDFILVSPELSANCITATVHNGASNWFLSDHYPVSATFNLKD